MNWGRARDWAASWQWGDAPAWLAFILGVAALIISIWAQRDGRRSADAAVKSVEEARLSRVAAQQSAADGRRAADAAEASLALEREAVQAAADAARPKVQLKIERAGSSRNPEIWLTNVGDADASNLSFAEDSRYRVSGSLDSEFAAGQTARFTFSSGSQPDQLWFTWDGQSEPKPVAIPPRAW